MTNKNKAKGCIILSILCLFVLNMSCNDEPGPCETTEAGPLYTLSDLAKEYFENYYDATNIIYVDALGEEKTVVLSNLENTTGIYGFSKTCETDNDLFQYVEGESQIIKLFLTHADLTKSIYLQLVEYPEREEEPSFEAVEVYYGDLVDLEEGDGLFHFDINRENEFATTHDSLELNGKIYYNVIDIQDASTEPNLEIKYTKSQGIIYIKNNQNNEEYFYLRKE